MVPPQVDFIEHDFINEQISQISLIVSNKLVLYTVPNISLLD